MAKAEKSIDVPGGEKVNRRKLVTFAVMGAAILAAWNWSGRIPGIGPYAIRGKAFIRKILGG